VLVTAATAVSFSEPLEQPQQLLQVAAAVSGADVKCNAGGLFNLVCGVQFKRCVHINKQQQQQQCFESVGRADLECVSTSHSIRAIKEVWFSSGSLIM
jgi:hypothetical protein